MSTHHQWRGAVDREESRPSDTKMVLDWSAWRSEPPVPVENSLLAELNRQKSSLIDKFHRKLHQSKKSGGPPTQDELVYEATLLRILYGVNFKIASVSGSPLDMFRPIDEYDWDRMMSALLAVSYRLYNTEYRLRVSQRSKIGMETKEPERQESEESPHTEDFEKVVSELVQSHKAEIEALILENANDSEKVVSELVQSHKAEVAALLQENAKDSEKAVSEVVQSHKAEIEALLQENTKDKNNFSILSLDFSRLLHDMSEHIQTAKTEKLAIVAAQDIQILTLRERVSQQQSLIKTLLGSMQQHLSTAAVDIKSLSTYIAYEGANTIDLEAYHRFYNKLRAEQCHCGEKIAREMSEQNLAAQRVLVQEQASEIQKKDVMLKDMKQEMEQKEKSRELERENFKRKIADLEERLEKKDVMLKQKKEHMEMSRKLERDDFREKIAELEAELEKQHTWESGSEWLGVVKKKTIVKGTKWNEWM